MYIAHIYVNEIRQTPPSPCTELQMSFCNTKGQTQNPWSLCGRISLLHKPMLEDAANDFLMIPTEQSGWGKLFNEQTPTAGCGIFGVSLTMHSIS